MSIFSKRYFVWISFVFLLFSRLCFELEALALTMVLLGFAAVLLALCFAFRNNGSFKNLGAVAILLFAAAIFGTLNTGAFLSNNEKIKTEYSGQREIRGYVSEVVAKNDFLSELVVKVEEIDGEHTNLTLLLVTEHKSELIQGEFFLASVRAMPMDEYENVLYLQNAKSNDFPLVCVASSEYDVDIIDGEFRIETVLSGLKSKLSSKLKVNVGKGAGELASALLLGNRELLSDVVLRDFRRAGVYHMLALSGLHVAILVGILELILKKLFISRPIRVVILATITLFYVALTGFQLSACRSMLMLWALYVALALEESNDTMTALFAAVSLVVLLQPSAVTDLGLLLSFLSTLGVVVASMMKNKLLFFQRIIDAARIKGKLIKAFRGLVYSLLVSLCVCVATLPVISTYFGELSLATFVSNLFMGAICEIFMVSSIFALVFSGAGAVGVVFAKIAALVGELLISIISLISSIDGIVISLGFPFVEYLVWGAFILSLVFLSMRLSRKWLIAVPSVLFAVLFCASALFYNIERADGVDVEFMYDDVLVISSLEGVYLCDASNGSYGSFYDGINLAKKNCFTQIDGVILTHYHNYHARSLERLASNYIVKRVIVPMPLNYQEGVVMRSIVRVLEEKGVEVYIYNTNEELDILSGTLIVSDRAYTAGRVNPSVCVSFEYGESRFTLVERPYFGTYLEKSGSFEEYIFDSDILVFGSDGSEPEGRFEIFEKLNSSCETYFTDFYMMDKSDFEEYMNERKIYFSLGYKRFELK